MSLRHRIAGQFPTLVLARRNVSRAKVRSALAAAAILIGVVAIGAIGAGGAAFKQSQLDTIREQGANNVYIYPGVANAERSFDRTDLLEIQETVGAAGVVGTRGGSMRWRQRPGRYERVSLTYMDDPRALYEVRWGTVPDNWRRSAVLSHEFATANGLQPGDRMVLTEQPDPDPGTGTGTDAGAAEAERTRRTYRVVAVLEPTEAFGVSEVFLPIEEAPERRYGQVRITTGTVDRAEVVAEALRERFNDRRNRLLVLEFTSLVRLFKQIVTGINTFLAALAAISLLVAGVSIANTMLMAVIERREEIGVLRAVGYTRTDIVRVLLVEAAILGAMGAAVGVAIATLVAMAANAVFLGDPMAFTRTSMLYLAGAVAFGVATSVVAGVYPALRAARERPVEALRG